MQRQSGPSQLYHQLSRGTGAEQGQRRFAEEHSVTLALLGSLDQLPKIEMLNSCSELHGAEPVSRGRIALTHHTSTFLPVSCGSHTTAVPPLDIRYDQCASTGSEPCPARAPGCLFLCSQPHTQAQPQHPVCPRTRQMLPSSNFDTHHFSGPPQ